MWTSGRVSKQDDHIGTLVATRCMAVLRSELTRARIKTFTVR